jgi:hypothetical protein
MSFGAKLDILAFIPHIFIFDSFGCQHKVIWLTTTLGVCDIEILVLDFW